MSTEISSAPAAIEVLLRRLFKRDKSQLDERTTELLRRYGTTDPHRIVRAQKRHRPIT